MTDTGISCDHRPQAASAAQAPFGRRAVIRVAAGVAAGLSAPAILAHAQPATIRIGSIEALTGPSAAYGIRAHNGVLLATEDLNRTGVVIGGTTYKIEIVSGDMANDARQALTLLRQHASDEALVCELGPTNSVGYLPAIPVAAQLMIPSIGTGSGAPVKDWNPWCFRVNPVSTFAVPAMLAKSRPCSRRSSRWRRSSALPSSSTRPKTPSAATAWCVGNWR